MMSHCVVDRTTQTAQNDPDCLARVADSPLVAVGGRAEEMAGLFTTDGELELDGTVEHGRERLLEIYRKPFEAVRPIPTVHNHVIDLDGDQATGYCAPALRMVQEGEAVTAAAHQEDLFEWEEGV